MMTVTDRLRVLFGGVIGKIALGLMRAGLNANQIPWIGFIGNIIATVFIAKGSLMLGGIFAGGSCLLDALDGAIARASGGGSRYGALLDSTLDRFSEYALFLGLLIHFIGINNQAGILLAFLSFAGSILVSYVRAKGEGLGISVKRGLMTRVERLVVLIFSLLIRQPFYGLLIIAILGNFTAVQRFWIVRSFLLEKEGVKND
jgi:CDP-diacylglycerol--glycerol-3-phosphate 3-phosphatidyltransferase